MSFKKSWDMGYGKDTIIKIGGSSLSMLGLDMVKLSKGEAVEYNERGKEHSLIILGGSCSINGDGFEYKNIGKRKNVFDGAATAIYIPRNRRYVITGETEVVVAVCKAPAEADYEPALVLPDDIIIKQLGRDGWQREAHFIIDERISADKLYIGEAYVNSGMWASYPPHKHDEDNMPAEGILEEIYYFEFNKPQGFGIQKVYSKEGEIDETYTVKTGDVVEIPKGYHPYVCAPGYDSYYLWIMAGKNRGFFMTTEEGHQWLVKK